MRLDRPLGITDVADYLGYTRFAADRWYQRGRLPEPDGYLSKRYPWWWRSTITRWARVTKRDGRAELARIAPSAEEFMA